MKGRRSSEVAIFLLFFLVPYLNLFRIDIPSGRYYWFTLSFPFSQAFPLLLTILWLVFLVIGLNVFKPRMFCSHICPHGAASQWLHVLQRHRLDLPLAIVLTPLIAFTLLSYFIDPGDAWRGITTLSSPMTAAFFLGLCLFIGLLLVRLRQRFCANVCPYGFLQQLFTPDKISKSGKIAVALLLLLLAGGMTIAALTTPRTEMSLNQTARMKTAPDTMTYTYTLTLLNGQSEAETFTLAFYDHKPIGSGLEQPLRLQPGEEKVLSFAFQARKTEQVRFDVTAQQEGRTKTFEWTLTGP